MKLTTRPGALFIPTRATFLLDQVVNSSSNLAVTLTLARQLPAREFGYFALLQSMTLLMQSVSAGGLIDYLLRTTEDREPRFHGAAKRLWKAGLLGLLPAALSILWCPPWLIAGIAAVALVPSLCFIDYQRAYLIGSSRTGRALELDLCYAALQGVMLACLMTFQAISVANVWLGWLMAASMVMLICHLLNVRPAGESPQSLFSLRFGLEAAALNGGSTAAQFCVVASVGLSFSAGYRLVQILFAPVAFLIVAARLVFLPALAAASDKRHLVRMAALFYPSATAAYGVLVALLGAPLFSRTFPETWLLARPYVLPVAFGFVLQALNAVVTFSARAMRLDRSVSRARTIQVLALAGGTSAACMLANPLFFVWAVPAGNACSVALLVGHLNLALRQLDADHVGPSSELMSMPATDRIQS